MAKLPSPRSTRYSVSCTPVRHPLPPVQERGASIKRLLRKQAPPLLTPCDQALGVFLQDVTPLHKVVANGSEAFPIFLEAPVAFLNRFAWIAARLAFHLGAGERNVRARQAHQHSLSAGLAPAKVPA